MPKRRPRPKRRQSPNGQQRSVRTGRRVRNRDARRKNGVHRHDSPGGRLSSLDTLRGVAIGLMILDHVAGIWLQLPLGGSAVRFVTRLSMPLFCVLMGYFLRPQRRWKRRRVLEIFAAAVAVNLLFWPYAGSIEILGTLLLAYGCFAITGHHFGWFVLAMLFYPVDGLRGWFDFPPSLTVSFVAQGFLLRRFGPASAIASGALLSSAAIWIESLEPRGVNQLLCLFILPATLLVYLGETKPQWRVPGLELAGRYPLTVYVLQYYVILGIYWVAKWQQADIG